MHRLRTYAGVAALVVVLVPPAPVHAASPLYVAMGDSYSSGTGTTHSAGACARSPDAYPALLATRREMRLQHVACSGASTYDVMNDQIAALSAHVNLVTITIGGNDSGFADIMRACVGPLVRGCEDTVDEWSGYVHNELSSALSDVYTSIREASPFARVLVIGYPHIYDQEDSCPLLVGTHPSNQRTVNTFADLLNATIRDAASAHDLEFVPVIKRFDGHGACSASPWINGLVVPFEGSYHPNDAGHREGYADAVDATIG